MNKSEKPYFLYVLECSNAAFYTGITTDFEKRYAAHLAGKAAKYTRSFKPVRVVALWRVEGDRALAQSLEKRVKGFTRAQKLALISGENILGNNCPIINHLD